MPVSQDNVRVAVYKLNQAAFRHALNSANVQVRHSTVSADFLCLASYYEGVDDTSYTQLTYKTNKTDKELRELVVMIAETCVCVLSKRSPHICRCLYITSCVCLLHPAASPLALIMRRICCCCERVCAENPRLWFACVKDKVQRSSLRVYECRSFRSWGMPQDSLASYSCIHVHPIFVCVVSFVKRQI